MKKPVNKERLQKMKNIRRQAVSERQKYLVYQNFCGVNKFCGKLISKSVSKVSKLTHGGNLVSRSTHHTAIQFGWPACQLALGTDKQHMAHYIFCPYSLGVKFFCYVHSEVK